MEGSLQVEDQELIIDDHLCHLLLKSESLASTLNQEMSSEASSASVTRKDLRRNRRSVQDLSTITEEVNSYSRSGMFEALRCCICASEHRKRSDSDNRSQSPMSKSQLTTPQTKLQLVVLGPSRVGKTALVLRNLRRHFEADFGPTIEDVYIYTIKMPDGERHEVIITDTAGSLQYPDLREDSIRSGDGFVIVFALNNVESFHESIQICDQILSLRVRAGLLICAELPHRYSSKYSWGYIVFS
ncbi:uncharacterized protein NPIL_450011 [Nephila pilipes]|uniref:Uncharacterized protein n=1 Tax=Nephila pilipes TaxID=299642 RepID=A0A8X6I322_NEPPI|nr:uncharacterized protein NPIL_450011 [Nephila pilipes]